jgi:hypothetical protein
MTGQVFLAQANRIPPFAITIQGAGFATGTTHSNAIAVSDVSTIRYDFVSIPEPSTLLLLLAGLPFWWFAWRRFRLA